MISAKLKYSVTTGSSAEIIDFATAKAAKRPTVRRQVKLSKNEILRRLRLGDLRRLLRDRCGSVLPDDDAGREYLKELLLPISLGPNEAIRRPSAVEIWGPTTRMRREIELWAPWMSEDEARDLRLEVNAMPTWQRKPMARTLGERLQVPYAERARLGLRTIGPFDVPEAGMALMRKRKKRERAKLRRQRQPRADFLAAHGTSRTKPWEEAGMSRATWYRRMKQEQASETGVCPINLIKTDHTLVSREGLSSEASSCVRPSTATPAGQTGTCPDGLLTAGEAAWLVRHV